MTKIIALFPGQGSQRVGMGKALFESWPRAKELFAIADETLGYSLSTLCFNGPEEELNKTENAQPALLTVSTIAYEYLLEQLPSISVQAMCGHSLGEYSALVAGGAIPFASAVELVHQRGTFMQEAVPAGSGGMAAVIGATLSEIEKACAEASHADGRVEIANLNEPGQTVISGEKNAVARAQALLAQYRVVELQVSVPSHCYLMAPAAVKLSERLQRVGVVSPKTTVYANVTAQPHQSPESIISALSQQLIGRVRWYECVHNAMQATETTTVIEFGSGGVLSNLMKKISPDTKRFTFENPTKVGTLVEGLLA